MEKRSSPFGTYVDWMAAAIKSGYPLAQVRAAAMAGLQGGDKREARALALDALRSRDAEVVWELSSTAAFLKSDEPGEGHEQLWTWRMAACLRAADCNSMTDWKRLMCEVDSQCHRDDTVVDVIRRGVGNNIIEIERRARELNEKIDAGSVDSSDL
jgi:hypothetical protein